MDRPHRVLRHSLCTDGEPVHIDGAALLVVEPLPLSTGSGCGWNRVRRCKTTAAPGSLPTSRGCGPLCMRGGEGMGQRKMLPFEDGRRVDGQDQLGRAKFLPGNEHRRNEQEHHEQ
eukprot:scaffold51202_cov65-Phaeocystis_antarctica.AAC.9